MPGRIVKTLSLCPATRERHLSSLRFNNFLASEGKLGALDDCLVFCASLIKHLSVLSGVDGRLVNRVVVGDVGHLKPLHLLKRQERAARRTASDEVY